MFRIDWRYAKGHPWSPWCGGAFQNGPTYADTLLAAKSKIASAVEELEQHRQHVHQFRVVDYYTLHVVFSTAADEPVYQGPRPTAWARLLGDE